MSLVTTALSSGAVALLLIGGTASTMTPAAAAPITAAEKAAQKKATAECKAEIKEKAKYEAMSWYARHKAVKNCVREKLAGSH